MTQRDQVEAFLLKVLEVMDENPPVFLNDLAIDGHEIMQILGFSKPCKEIGDVKNILMNLVLADPSYNTKEKLTDYVEKLSLAKAPASLLDEPCEEDIEGRDFNAKV